MDKDFAINVSGCSQEQIKEMADWLCERFDVEIHAGSDALDNSAIRNWNYLFIVRNSLLVGSLSAESDKKNTHTTKP